MTGADLKKLGSDFGVAGATTGFAKDVNGFKTAQVLLLGETGTTLPDADGSTKYGYIVSDPYTGKEGSTLYVYFTLWNGSESIDVKDKISAEADANGLAKGKMVSYKDLGDGVVDATAEITGFTEGAVKAYDGTYIQIKTSSETKDLKITSDTVIIYVNTSAKAGVEGGEISIADEKVEGKLTTNIYFKAATDATKAGVLFVDVNNNINGGATVNK